MLAPANDCFLYQELCVCVCLQALRKVASCTFKSFKKLAHAALFYSSEMRPIGVQTL